MPRTNNCCLERGTRGINDFFPLVGFTRGSKKNGHSSTKCVEPIEGNYILLLAAATPRRSILTSLYVMYLLDDTVSLRPLPLPHYCLHDAAILEPAFERNPTAVRS